MIRKIIRLQDCYGLRKILGDERVWKNMLYVPPDVAWDAAEVVGTECFVDSYGVDTATGSNMIGGAVWARRFARRKHVHAISFAIAPDFQKKGLAVDLFNALAEYLTIPGVNRFEVEVLEWNAPMLRLAEKLGFLVEGRKKSAFIDARGTHDLICLGKVFVK